MKILNKLCLMYNGLRDGSYRAMDPVPAQLRLSMSEVACSGCLGSCARARGPHITESTYGLSSQGVIAYLGSSVLAYADDLLDEDRRKKAVPRYGTPPHGNCRRLNTFRPVTYRRGCRLGRHRV